VPPAKNKNNENQLNVIGGRLLRGLRNVSREASGNILFLASQRKGKKEMLSRRQVIRQRVISGRL